jgi:hypothetical protein
MWFLYGMLGAMLAPVLLTKVWYCTVHTADMADYHCALYLLLVLHLHTSDTADHHCAPYLHLIVHCKYSRYG